MPTYNERVNVESIVPAIRAAVPDATILIVDDGSPDGTGELADALAATDDHVRVLHRTTKDGLARAYSAGFDQALAAGATTVIQMDADWSHPPSSCPPSSHAWTPVPTSFSGRAMSAAAGRRAGRSSVASSRAAATSSPSSC